MGNIAKLIRLGFRSHLWEHEIWSNPKRIANYFLGDPIRSDPSIIQIEPTSLCNMSCCYCIQHNGKGEGSLSRPDTPSGNTGLDLFEDILDRHPNAAILQLQGQGEPLLHPQYARLVEIAKRKGFVVYTISNGMLLDSEKQDMLFDSGLDAYFASLDMSDPNEMEYTRRGMSYPTVVDNLVNLREKRNRRHSKLLFGISSVVARKNIGRMKEFLEKYDKEIRPDIVIVSSLASNNACDRDYMNLYQNGLKRMVINDNVELPDTSNVRAYVSTTSRLSYRNYCLQTRSRYYRFDGSTAYCQSRHKVDSKGNDEMRIAASQMLNGIVPTGCSGCHLLPKAMR